MRGLPRRRTRATRPQNCPSPRIARIPRDCGRSEFRYRHRSSRRERRGYRRSTFISAKGGSTVEAKIAQFHDQGQRFSHRLNWSDVFPGKVLTPYAASDRAHDAFATAPYELDCRGQNWPATGDNGHFCVSGTRFLRARSVVRTPLIPRDGCRTLSRVRRRDGLLAKTWSWIGRVMVRGSVPIKVPL